MTNIPERTVRIEQDPEGIWVLRETIDGQRHYTLAQSAEELHREGWIFFQQKWLRQPSRGGSVFDMLAQLELNALAPH